MTKLSRRTVLAVSLAGASVALFAAMPASGARSPQPGVLPRPHAAPSASVAPLKVPPSVELVVILALQNPSGPDDPEIAKWPSAAKPPLSLFKTRKVLQHIATATLPQGQAYPITVPNGPTLSLTFREIAHEDKKADRYSFGAVLTTPNKTTPMGLLMKSDDRVFIAGPDYQNGTLFFGIHVL